jgi:hypothetical protein
MAKKRRIVGKRRHGGGRRYDPNARRRHTTRAGRRGEDVRDHGSVLLRAKKRVLTSRDDVEMTPAGVLYGFGYLDREQYDKLGCVTGLLHRIARSFGRDASPAGLWLALVAAASRTRPGMPTIVGDHGARDALTRICRRLDGSRDLVLELAAEGGLPPICLRAAEHRLTPRDLVQLELLRRGLDGISPSRAWQETADHPRELRSEQGYLGGGGGAGGGGGGLVVTGGGGGC